MLPSGAIVKLDPRAALVGGGVAVIGEFDALRRRGRRKAAASLGWRLESATAARAGHQLEAGIVALLEQVSAPPDRPPPEPLPPPVSPKSSAAAGRLAAAMSQAARNRERRIAGIRRLIVLG